MRAKGIALCRISSINQSDGHSLEAQRGNVDKKSTEMEIPIIKYWEVIRSSKAGKNISRSDLNEITRFCRQNKEVKFLFLDRVNRLMREMKYMIHYIVELEILGVKIIFCDPEQEYLNANDKISDLLLIIEAFKSEQENVEREQTVVSRMKSRFAAGYYLSHPHAGYITSDIPGIHIPDPLRFKLLQKCCRLLIYDSYTLPQAIKWLKDQNYRTRGGKKMDIDHFSNFIVKRYYCGIIDVNKDNWPKNVQGLHEPMLSIREHSTLVAILFKRNPRIRNVHNPEFPLANLLRHTECKNIGKYEKFGGHYYNRGKRPNGRERNKTPVYDCRDCRKRIARERVHVSLTNYLDSLQFVPGENQFKAALVKIWKNQRGSVAQRVASLSKNIANIEQKVKEIAISYSSEGPGAAKQALKSVIDDYDEQLKQINLDIERLKAIDMESEDFVNFAIRFVEQLREKWWDLSWENMARGVQILFNGKIYIDNSAIVHPSDLSSIYRLGTNKKALENASNAHLVEHLEKSSPLIVQEISRWHDLLWEDYQDYQLEVKRREKIVVP